MCFAFAAVPAFLMASGAVLHRYAVFDWRRYIIRLIKTTAVLYVWKIIYRFAYMIFCGDTANVDDSVMWYIKAYIVCLLFYPVSFELIQSKNGERALLFFTLVCFADGIIFPSIGRNAIQYANTVFYFLSGVFVMKYLPTIKNKLSGRRYIAFILMAVGTAGLVYIKYRQTGLLSWGGIYINDGYSHVSTCILSLGFFLCFALYDNEKLYSFLGKWIGKYTLGIYYMHFLILGICSRTVYAYIPAVFGMNTVKTIIVVSFCAIATGMLRKIPLIKELV